MIFNIKQYATLPILQLKLIRDGRNDYNKFYKKLENATVTFAMKDVASGRLQVANEEGMLLLKDGCNEMGQKEYYIGYAFTQDDTKIPGIYTGEFKLIFLDDMSELITPINEELQIHVIESFVKAKVN